MSVEIVEMTFEFPRWVYWFCAIFSLVAFSLNLKWRKWGWVIIWGFVLISYIHILFGL